MGLDVDLIRKLNFKPPSELDLSDLERVEDIMKQVSHCNRNTLGMQKRKVATRDAKDAISSEIEGLAKYSTQLRLLVEGHKLTKIGTGLKLRGNQYVDYRPCCTASRWITNLCWRNPGAGHVRRPVVIRSVDQAICIHLKQSTLLRSWLNWPVCQFMDKTARSTC